MTRAYFIPSNKFSFSDENVRDVKTLDKGKYAVASSGMSVSALGDPYFITALRTVGVEGNVVRSTKEAEEAVDLLVAKGKCKVLVISYKLADMLERKRNELTRRGIYYPVFVTIPGLDGDIEGRTHRLYDLVSQAVGAKLKLGEELSDFDKRSFTRRE